MARISQFLDRWLGRASGFYSFWPLIPSGVVAAMIAYLSTGVTWIANLGPFGWTSAGLLTFVLSSLGFALSARAKLWKLDLKNRERLAGDGSSFDPMASVYQNKRLFLRDLVPPGRRFLAEKKFIECEIIGPGNIVVALNKKDGSGSIFRGNTYHDVDCIQIVSDKHSLNATYFPGCDFDGCNFFNINLLFYTRVQDSWNWITPLADSPPLLTGPDDAALPE